MDEHYPTNGSSSLSYQWINIVLPTDLHHHYPPDGSLASSSYQWIIITLLMDHRHPINEASLPYQWSINIIILSMEQHHSIIIAILSMKHHYPINGASSSSYHVAKLSY
ncbi:hypothetical protein KY289_005814 [Solanum tuberosum]|nr:hypothetical protein KY289_005814 [Solanum tuberosum]